MIKTVTYHATEPGPRLLIIGAIHGNEKCGTVAINNVIEDIEADKLHITRGRVTFIPICNPRAYTADERYIERNLNRYLVPMEKPDTYEAKLGNSLCPYFANCDALLDIHSYTIGGDPFISYDGGDAKEHAYAASLGVPTLLTGWVDVYAAMGKGKEAAKPDESTGGPQYARRHGAVAVTLECGQHKDAKSPKIAHQGILNMLRYFNVVEGKKAATETPPPPRNIRMTQLFYRDNLGEFPKSWKNFEPVKAGDVMAKYPDKEITAPEDGFIIMPKPGCPVDEEWFYFGVERPPTAG